MNIKHNSINRISTTAILASIAAALMFLEFSLPFIPSFLAVDFSNVPAMIGAFYGGPICGVLVCLIKNVLHLAVTKSFFIGELCDFLLGMSLALVTGLICKMSKSNGIKSGIFASVMGVLTMSAVSFPVNMYISLPFYTRVYFNSDEELLISVYRAFIPSLQNLAQCVLAINVPFTLAKGIINAVIALALWSRLKNVLLKNEQ